MADGTALLATMFHSLRAMGLWSGRRGPSLLDGAAPFYRAYETADGGYMAVGAIEPQFYDDLLDGLGLAAEDLPRQIDRSRWPEVSGRFAEVSPPAPGRSGSPASRDGTPAWRPCSPRGMR